MVGYATKFKYLSEFCAPAGEKEWKCRRFEEGLDKRKIWKKSLSRPSSVFVRILNPIGRALMPTKIK